MMTETAPAVAAAAAAADVPTGNVGKIAGLYDLLETLGSGHFAVVKLARHVFTGAKVAVKVVDKTKLDKVSQDHLYTEVRCMKLVQHPNVVRLYEVIDTQTKLYLILELGDGGDLYDYIMKHDGGLNEELAKKYFRQILKAISYCHQLHVVHRDLKPENVVFFEKLGVVKLTDFGFSNKYSPGQKLETSCGSLAYSAPEILLGDSYDAPAVDIWSLGVILYMLVCGQPPFEKASDSETLTMIMDCKYPPLPTQISQECRDLIATMLVRDPKGRATLAEIAQSAWLKKNAEDDSIYDSSIPLVSRQQLSEEDHAFIIQKMINGQIATKEKILKSLETNNYDHITATYYLLAELRLRKQREELALKERSLHVTDSSIQKRPNILDDSRLKTGQTKKMPLVPIAINVSSSTPTVEICKPDKRTRKCSIVREEDEEDSSCEHAGGANELRVAVTRRESISDGRLNRTAAVAAAATGVQQQQPTPMPTPKAPTPLIVQNAHNNKKIIVSVDAALARKLNQIENMVPRVVATPPPVPPTSSSSTTETLQEEDEDENMQDTLRGLKELEIGKLKPLPTSSGSKNAVLTHHRRSKLNKIRTPSCSSSEASDDDTKTRNKKKMNRYCNDMPTRFRMNRRDSYDDSSDSQDQAFSSAAGGARATIIAAAANSNSKVGGSGDDKKDGQSTQGKDHKQQSEETRKSTHKHKKHQSHQHQKDSIDQLLQDIAEKSLSISDVDADDAEALSAKGRRRRVRESQSLDRITEAQELRYFELRQRSNLMAEQRNSLCNLSSCSVAETNEEYDDDYDYDEEDEEHENENVVDKAAIAATATVATKSNISILEHTKNALNIQFKRNNHQYNNNKHNIYNIHSISELDLILEHRNSNIMTENATKMKTAAAAAATNNTTTKQSKPKAIQVAGTKCFVTIRKIRKLGKYFPVVNFSS